VASTWNGFGQIVPRACNGDVLFLHGLQQRRLRARAGAVDFVGHQELREYRSGDEAERPLAGIALVRAPRRPEYPTASGPA
jgi:hypothetical protein